MNYLNAFNENLSQYKVSDTGRVGKAFEATIHGIARQRKLYTVTAQGRVDLKMRINGVLTGIEVKTACGEVQDSFAAAYVVYAPHVDAEDPLRYAYVFSQDAWQDMLFGYSGKGSLLRDHESRGTTNIQSFYWSETVRPAASKKLGRYILSCCEAQPTFVAWMEAMGRRI